MSVLNQPYFQDEAAAYAKLESILWPDGPVCPKCGVVDQAYELKGKRSRVGLRRCGACKADFTVKVGTVFESSHIPLHKWFQAAYLMCASKKGMSANQLHRTLEITYKSAWFMAHRIREAMRVICPTPMGGENQVVEIDETYVGGKAKNRKGKVPSKEAMIALVERGGRVRSFHVANVNARTLKPIIKEHVDRATYVMTDESPVYPTVVDGRAHGTVNHSQEEYVRAYWWHTNTVEGYFSILKRGIVGVYHHVSPAHLHRYAAEFDFRYNERAAVGVDDQARTVKALRGIVGKRLTYRDSSAV